jgi:hypothetical protein
MIGIALLGAGRMARVRLRSSSEELSRLLLDMWVL